MSQKSTGGSRKRAPNFSREEQMLLYSVMEPYMHIVENKKTDEIKQHVKQSTWAKITYCYNANTKSLPRTTENLLACYRNMKIKLKKQHSESKMCLKDSNATEELLSAVEEHDKDWEAVAEQLNKPIVQCKEDFESLKKEYQKQENIHKKAVLGTGGGPPPSDDGMEPFIKIKKLLEPQIDGLFTLYDGDAKLMTKYQESLPEKERVKPIEHSSNLNFDAAPSHPTIKNKFKTVQNLAVEKLELVQMQKKLVEMEIEHKKNIFALELEEMHREHKYMEEKRQKEIILLDLKIKKFSDY